MSCRTAALRSLAFALLATGSMRAEAHSRWQVPPARAASDSLMLDPCGDTTGDGGPAADDDGSSSSSGGGEPTITPDAEATGCGCSTRTGAGAGSLAWAAVLLVARRQRGTSAGRVRQTQIRSRWR